MNPRCRGLQSTKAKALAKVIRRKWNEPVRPQIDRYSVRYISNICFGFGKSGGFSRRIFPVALQGRSGINRSVCSTKRQDRVMGFNVMGRGINRGHIQGGFPKRREIRRL